MPSCTICGKLIWQYPWSGSNTWTYAPTTTTATGTSIGPWFNNDLYCQGHIRYLTTSNTTGTITIDHYFPVPVQMPYAETPHPLNETERRQAVPQAFYDAFKDEEED